MSSAERIWSTTERKRLEMNTCRLRKGEELLRRKRTAEDTTRERVEDNKRKTIEKNHKSNAKKESMANARSD